MFKISCFHQLARQLTWCENVLSKVIEFPPCPAQKYLNCQPNVATQPCPPYLYDTRKHIFSVDILTSSQPEHHQHFVGSQDLCSFAHIFEQLNIQVSLFAFGFIFGVTEFGSTPNGLDLVLQMLRRPIYSIHLQHTCSCGF